MYMKFKQSFRILILSAIVLILSLFFTGCDSYQSITFVNQTTYQIKTDVRTVDLDYDGYVSISNFTWDTYVDGIEAGESKKYVASIKTDKEAGSGYKYIVEAINQNNTVLFAHIFTWDELHNMNWEVVITAE